MHKHSRGAVTVLVTLLLIPAILVSGTGVDLSRIYAARSATRDANQLAANAVLTNYDRLLHDLYGLYAVIADDDNLTEMVDTYVKASLFGENVTDAQLGEFRLFIGTENPSSEVISSDPLSNVEILRRQIEEYSKYRVPVAIVSDILDRLQDSGAKQMEANNEAIAKKIAVDEQLEVVMEKFRAVIDKAAELKKDYDDLEKNEYDGVNGILSSIQKQLDAMLQVRKEYETEFNKAAPDQTKLDDLIAHYEAISINIASLAHGGPVGSDWVPAHIDDEGNDVPGAWKQTLSLYAYGLKPFIDSSISNLKGYSRLDELIEACQAADAAKIELQKRINELDAKLKDGTCSSELVKNMQEELEQYNDLLKYDFTDLGTQWKARANSYITGASIAALETIQGYGDPDDSSVISFENLKKASSLRGFHIRQNIDTAIYKDIPDNLSAAAAIINKPNYKQPGGFPTFEGVSEEHKQCVELIKNIEIKSSSESLTEEEEKRKGDFIKAFKKLKDIWSGLTDYDPSPGASKYTGSSTWAFTTQGAGMELDFGLGDFSFGDTEDSGIRSTLKTFTGLLSGNISATELIGNVLANASNRVLLVGYSTQMFSNWTTKSGMESGETYLSLTGKTIDASNNYFLNSEWEYLFNGSLDAGKNLGKVTVTMLALRFLANYASSYMITEVNMEIREYEALVSAIPFAGAALRFLVRPLIVLAESVIDVSLLRSGYAVPLLKTSSDPTAWHFSLMSFTMSFLEDAEASASKKKGLLYTDYLTMFLLASDPDVLASRIGDLIALNTTTSKEKIAINNPDTKDKDERADAIAPKQLFDLSKAYTTFAVQTETYVRFAFLSMPLAQQGINGIVPSTTFPVNVTTYRGY